MSSLPNKNLDPAERLKILKIYIDGNWSLTDFVQFLFYLNSSFYYLALKTYHKKYRGKIIELEENGKLNYELTNDRSIGKVKIKSVQFSSPGWIELIFSASVVTALYGLITRYVPNHKDKRESRRMDAEIVKFEIETLKSVGYSKEEIRKVLEDRMHNLIGIADILDKNIKSGKITEIKELQYYEEHDEDPPDIVA